MKDAAPESKIIVALRREGNWLEENLVLALSSPQNPGTSHPCRAGDLRDSGGWPRWTRSPNNVIWPPPLLLHWVVLSSIFTSFSAGPR